MPRGRPRIAVVVEQRREVLVGLGFRRPIVRWTDDEWDELAKRVWKKRARSPDKHLWVLVNEVQAQSGEDAWPDDRKRVCSSMAMIKPLLKRLAAIDMEMHTTATIDVPRLKDTIESLQDRPSKDQILANLLPEEAVRRFSGLVMESLSPT